VLVDELPDDDCWKAKLRPLEIYLPYATTYRYPTPGGRIAAAPDMAQVSADADVIDALIKKARADLK
jgi:hypothetical protein